MYDTLATSLHSSPSKPPKEQAQNLSLLPAPALTINLSMSAYSGRRAELSQWYEWKLHQLAQDGLQQATRVDGGMVRTHIVVPGDLAENQLKRAQTRACHIHDEVKSFSDCETPETHAEEAAAIPLPPSPQRLPWLLACEAGRMVCIEACRIACFCLSPLQWLAHGLSTVRKGTSEELSTATDYEHQIISDGSAFKFGHGTHKKNRNVRWDTSVEDSRPRVKNYLTKVQNKRFMERS